MSAPKKKNLQDDEPMGDQEPESDAESGEDSDPDRYTGNEEIQVDFEGRSPIDVDLPGIQQLLHQLFLKAHINITQMAEEIVGQNYIGSVVTQSEVDEEDDDDDEEDLYDSNMIFGVTTVLNMMSKKDLECIEQLRAYVVEKASSHAEDSVAAQFRDILGNNSRPVGFLLNERFINIPPQISVPLLENLYKEIRRANDKKMDYNFTHYLMILKFYRKEAKKGKPAEDIYSNPEEEVVFKEAIASFEYSVQAETDSGMSGDWLEGDSSLTPYRKVILCEASKLPHIVLAIKEFINE